MNDSLKPALAELIGTFTLTFIGAGAGALAGASGAGLVGVALAYGIAYAIIIYAWGAHSGAHVNPAVTFGLAVGGKITWERAIWYWVAQFLGAALAGYLLLYLIGAGAGLGVTLGSLTNGAASTDVIKGTIVEAVLTFFLVTAVYGTAVAGRNGNAAGIAIGLVLTMNMLMGGSLTGASMNPARSFGPALAALNFTNLWVYFVGPLAGAAAAGLLYSQVFLGKSAPAAKPPPPGRKQRR
jgi:MIP family channel proteins